MLALSASLFNNSLAMSSGEQIFEVHRQKGLDIDGGRVIEAAVHDLTDRATEIFNKYGIVGDERWAVFITDEEPDANEPSGWRNSKEVLVMLDDRPLDPHEDPSKNPKQLEDPRIALRILAIERNKQGDPYITEDFQLDCLGWAQYHMDMAPSAKEIESPDPSIRSVLFAIHDKKLEFWQPRAYTPMLGVSERGVETELPNEDIDMQAWLYGTPPLEGKTAEIEPVVFPYGFSDEPLDKQYALERASELLMATEGRLPIHHSNE